MLDTLNKETKKYKVAIYIRLSKEDIDKNEESLSVINQKNILLEYIEKNNYDLYDIYVDDGYTGTNFNRPEFVRMIKDIEIGKINMVITKDLSRLGRDYIETGQYIEKYFPMKRVRYVALLDGIDTELDTTNNDIAPFKAVINDMYSRDNSKKIRTALKSMQLKGKWVGSCPPLGYMKDPNNKNHLIENKEESYIVKKIFELAIKGLTYYQIKEKLIRDNIPTMSMIRKKRKNTQMANKGIWCTKTIKNILSNQMYVGDMVQNKGSRISYKIRKQIKNSKSRWIIVESTHDAIIDREVFKKVQKILQNSKIRTKKEIYRLFDGLLYCFDCKHKITICKPRKTDNRTYIVCNYYRMYSKQKLCTSHSYNYDILEDKILNIIKKFLKKNINLEKINLKAMELYKKYNNVEKFREKFNKIKKDITLKQQQMDKMYLEKLDFKITEEMYDRIKATLDKEIMELETNKEEISKLIYEDENIKKSDEECKRITKDLIEFNNPTRNIIVKLINRIEIHKHKKIDIYFNFF